MSQQIKQLAENILFASLIFILVLLCASDKIAVPYWLQPIGRMHPMLLHFPIVLLLLAMLLECLRFNRKYKDNPFYHSFLKILLLSATLLSSITVIMGLFLSQEEGYSGDVLFWHKWTGVLLVFTAALLYWVRNKSWYNSMLAKIGAFFVTIAIVLTGHYGASLTHGENYVLAPLQTGENVPLEEAIVFDHVIQPILTAKCLSCHNTEKAKGELLLHDEASILKGGKSGKLFIAGQPSNSLLIQRILLPIENEKHMAPQNKPQLTAEEVRILQLWIQGQASFKQKVIDLSPTDSLRLLASAKFAPTVIKYDFAAADPKTIESLNNDYRVISPLYSNSPALQVNLYNKNIYHANLLQELAPIKKQIVYLNLNSLPVKDEDLKIIEQFSNLNTLYLNATDITNEAVSSLKSLKNLKELTVYDTKITKENMKPLLDMNPNLKISGVQ